MPGSIAIPPLPDAATPWWRSRPGGVLRGGTTATLAQAVRVTLQVGAMSWMAHHVDPAQFGLVAMAMGLVGFGQVLAEGGIALTIVQRAHLDDETLTGLAVLAVVWAVMLSAALALLAPLVAHFYVAPRLAQIIWLALVIIPLNAAARLFTALMQRNGQWLRLELVAIISLIVGSVAGAGVALITRDGVAALMTQGLIMAGGNLVVGMIARPWRPRWPGQWRAFATPLLMGWHLTLFGLADYAVRQADDLLVGWRWGADALGLYGRAHALVGMASQLATGAATTVMLSTLSRARTAPAHWQPALHETLGFVMALAAVAQALLLALTPMLVDRVLGPQWQDCQTLVRILALGIVPGATIGCLNVALIAKAQTRRLLVWKLAVAPVWLGAFVLALPWGPQGVALAFVGASLLVAMAMTADGHAMPRGVVAWRAGLAMAVGAAPMIGLLPAAISG